MVLHFHPLYNSFIHHQDFHSVIVEVTETDFLQTLGTVFIMSWVVRHVESMMETPFLFVSLKWTLYSVRVFIYQFFFKIIFYMCVCFECDQSP